MTDYKNLQVWQRSIDFVVEIYSLVKSFPSEEKYALGDQMRRAAVSIPSNIAEGMECIFKDLTISYKSILKSNRSYWESSERNKDRAKFFREYHAKGIAGCDTKKHTFIMKVLKGVVRKVRIYLKCIG